MTEVLLQDYGFYIWSSVFITLSILIGNAAYAVYQLRRAQKNISL